MPKKTYIGVDNVAKQVKKMYIGIDNVAKKVKKAYIGINGYASLVFGEGKPTYYKKLSSMYSWSEFCSAASTQNHSFFGGGYGHVASRSLVHAYDNKDFTVYSTLSLTPDGKYKDYGRYYMGAISSQKYAFFGGGYTGTGADPWYSSSDYIDLYDQDLQHSLKYLPKKATALAAANLNNTYAIFAGGKDYITHNDWWSLDFIKFIDLNTLEDIGDYNQYKLLSSKAECSAASIKDRVIISGGQQGDQHEDGTPVRPIMEIIDKDLSIKQGSNFPYAASCKASSTSEFCGFLTGPRNGSALSNLVVCDYNGTIYNNLENFSVNRKSNAVTISSLNDYFLIAGGTEGSNAADPPVIYEDARIIDVYNNDLTKITNLLNLKLTVGKVGLDSTTTPNDYCLFGGGYSQPKSNYTQFYSIVDVFTLE